MNSVMLQDTKSVSKNLLFLYINNRLPEKFKKTIPFTTASKRIEYQGLILTKEVKTTRYQGKKIKETQINRYWEKLKKIQINIYSEN